MDNHMYTAVYQKLSGKFVKLYKHPGHANNFMDKNPGYYTCKLVFLTEV